jgi:hypothetical protein
MFPYQPLQQRSVGVSVNTPQATVGIPKTLMYSVPAQMMAVQYADEQGGVHTAVVLRVGNAWYMPPNAEQWAGALRPLAPWLARLCEDRLTPASSEVPQTDSVDLFTATAGK